MSYNLPIARVSLPACLKGQSNGKVDPKLLKSCGVTSGVMVEPAARAMKAMMAAARAAGFDPRHVGDYRSYERQVQMFNERYSKTPIPGRPTKVWNGVTYWQKPNTAMSAVPGTSNHGWGLALDIAEERNGKPGIDSISDAFVRWLIKNAATYGYSAEHNSEPWHWRYVAGDKIPAAVLAYEKSLEQPAPPALVTPVPAPQPVAPKPPKPAKHDTYTVVKGDSYWKIAEKVLKSGARWEEISKLNKGVALKPGMTIKVPKK